jgi:hypothetical protein
MEISIARFIKTKVPPSYIGSFWKNLRIDYPEANRNTHIKEEELMCTLKKTLNECKSRT